MEMGPSGEVTLICGQRPLLTEKTGWDLEGTLGVSRAFSRLTQAALGICGHA